SPRSCATSMTYQTRPGLRPPPSRATPSAEHKRPPSLSEGPFHLSLHASRLPPLTPFTRVSRAIAPASGSEVFSEWRTLDQADRESPSCRTTSLLRRHFLGSITHRPVCRTRAPFIL